MRARPSLAAVLVLAGGLLDPARVAGAEDEAELAGHMVAEALLTAHFIAAAKQAGMSDDAIRGVLKDVVARSAIDEIWVTDESGRAYLNSEDFEFRFDPDPAEAPQASAFWPLLEGEQEVVVQEARKREIDDQIFKYVGVAGIDQPRIVQVGVRAASPGE